MEFEALFIDIDCGFDVYYLLFGWKPLLIYDFIS